MKRRNSPRNRNQKNSVRSKAKRSQSLSYDILEKRQVLTVGTGFNVIGATLGEAGITSNLPNAEGDVSATHFVEIGQQTFTVYRRDGGQDATIVRSTTLNQFFEDAGADLDGESLQAPRIIYDRAIDRWFAIATGDGEGDFSVNRVHIAVSQTSDPAGQWQHESFVGDQTGQLLHTNASLGVDADGLYIATQNLDDNGNLVDVSIYTVPKADLLLPNTTVAFMTRHDNLSIFQFGRNIQFASNFDASDGVLNAFSTVSVDLNAGTGLPPNERLTPGTLNAFRITNADTPNSSLSAVAAVMVDPGLDEGPLVEPDPIFQPGEDGTGIVELMVPSGLTAGLIEANGSVFGAQTVGFDIVPEMIDTRSNGVNWFELDVSAGAPVAVQTEVFLDRTFFTDGMDADFIPDPDDTVEQGAIHYFNPSIAINDNGLVGLTFNGTINAEAAQFNILDTETLVTGAMGVPFDLTQFRIHTYATVGIRVQGAIQMEGIQLLHRSPATGPFDQAPLQETLWGRYSSVRPDPGNPNSLFSVGPFQTSGNPDRWSVAVTEITPVDLVPVVIGTSPDGNEIIISLDGDDTDFVEVTIDGVLDSRFELDLLFQLVVVGQPGNDTFIVDYVNGDPIPTAGLLLAGGDGTDSLEVRTDENIDFQTSGAYTLVTENGVDLPVGLQVQNTFLQFESITGGSGDDTFVFDGVLAGDANGGDGDDRFIFSGAQATNGSVNGGAGFNTLDLTERTLDTEIELFSVGQNMGFNGRTVSGPVGQFAQILDQFRDISLINGSASPLVPDDSLQALNVFPAEYTLRIPDIDPADGTPATADTFVTSTLEQNGETLFFTNFEILAGSVQDDVFNVQSNDGNALSFVQLNGRTGNDVFNFSSNAPFNSGVVGDIGGVFEVNGGAGDNSLIVSDQGRLGPQEFLVVAARISTNSSIADPLEIIYFAQDFDTGVEGTFDVTLIGSDGSEPDTFILQSFFAQNTLNVFGLGGDDTFLIQDLSQSTVEVFGGEGDDDYIIEQVDGIDDRDVTINDSIDAENDQVILAGTILDEVFIVDLNSFVSDQFTFIGVEEFGFDGRGGDDEFYVRAIDETVPVVLRGGDGNDSFFISSDAPTNLGDLMAIGNNLTIEDEVGDNQILISNESGNAIDVEVFEDQIVGLFEMDSVLNYSGIFELIDIIGSNGGDDRFVITSFLAVNRLQIDGRLGEDEFVIGSSDGTADINGEVLVDGGSDGDTYTVFLTNLESQNFTIQDTGFNGIDTLEARTTEGPEEITLTEFNIQTDTQTVQINEFFERIVINTMGGNDTIRMMNAPADEVVLIGNGGDDTIIVDGTVGVDVLEILARLGNDTILINDSSAFTQVNAFGGPGDDFLSVGDSALGNVVLSGGTGSDDYEISFANSGNRTVAIVDTDSDMETHTLSIGGASNGPDEITVNNNNVTNGTETISFGDLFDSLILRGNGGDDVFNVLAVDYDLQLFGGLGNDVFNLGSDAPAQFGNTDGITGNISVDGGDGLNHLNVINQSGTASNVTVTSEMIVGMTVNPITFTGRFDRADGEIGGITLFGSSFGDDVFDVISIKEGDSIRILGLAGNDIFNIGNGISGDAQFDGGNGNDTYNFQFGSDAMRDIVIEDTGDLGFDVLNLTGSQQNDNIVLTTDSISDASTTLMFNVPLNQIEIFGLGGNDIFTVNGAPNAVVSLHGNDGSDMFIVNSTDGIDDLNLFGGTSNDSFTFNGTSGLTRIDAHGSEGSDSYNVEIGAIGNLFLDGQEGSDTYNVQLGAGAARRISTKDTGASGIDSTIVTGTENGDRIAIRTTRFLFENEVVIFDENTEEVAANAADGSDRIVVFGSRSPLTEVFAGNGNDVFVVNGGSRADVINLLGQNGNDTFNVFKTTNTATTNLFGNGNNDRFNIGSNINSDNGNLGLIRGELNIFGGANDPGEEDQIFANDNGSAAAYSYRIDSNRISPIAGPANLPRENFAGINYDASTEFVRLDGTQFNNLFQVVASPITRFFFDGNQGTDRLTVVFQPNDGRQLTMTDPIAGNGFVTFTDGSEMVQFASVETPSLGTAGGVGSLTQHPDFDPMDDFFSSADLVDDIEDIDGLI